ncbi:MAG: energy transducer TonB, partial [Lysobacteraceae bacterium]
ARTMTPTPFLWLVLLLLPAAPLRAQDAAATASAAVPVQRPPLKPLLDAMVHSRLDRVTTRVLVEWDADGRVLAATVDPSTGDRQLDEAIRAQALQMRLKPGQAGRDWIAFALSL